MTKTRARGEATYFRARGESAGPTVTDDKMPQAVKQHGAGGSCTRLLGDGTVHMLAGLRFPLRQTRKPVINGGIQGFGSYASALWSPEKLVPIQLNPSHYTGCLLGTCK